MKKKSRNIALIAAAALLLTACGNNAATTTTTKAADAAATTTTTAEAATTTTAEVTTTTEGTAPTEEATDTSAPAEGTELITCNDFRGGTVDVPMTVNEYGSYEGKTDFAYFRRSTGECYTSDSNPELFDIASYTCNAECTLGESFTVKAGDVFGTLTVKEAKSDYYGYVDENGVKGGNWMAHSATFDGSATLDGYLIYFTEDEYGVQTGDIVFIPSPSSAAAVDFPIVQTGFIGGFTFMSENIGFALCGDTQQLRLGNLATDYADNAELNGIFDGSWNIKAATVTLGSISLEASEQFGSGHSSAKIEAVTLNN